jgi:hypothetical protein
MKSIWALKGDFNTLIYEIFSLLLLAYTIIYNSILTDFRLK